MTQHKDPSLFTAIQSNSGRNQSLEVRYQVSGQEQVVIVKLEDTGSHARLLVTDSMVPSPIMDTQIDFDGIEVATISIDENFCELEFGKFVIMISLCDECADIDVLNAQGDEYDLMQEKSPIADQLLQMLTAPIFVI